MAYESAGGSLKLKGLVDQDIKKKKKKSTKEKLRAAAAALSVNQVSKPQPDNSMDPAANRSGDNVAKSVIIATTKDSIVVQKPLKTKAELSYERMLEKRNEEKIFKKAERSHKEHVEEFNKHLDSLSEYHDVPKVSWTK
jgi:protein FAM32A